MSILLLNAGSSSLKCSLMDSASESLIAQALADWAGTATRYRFEIPGGEVLSEVVDWRGHAAGVRRIVADLRQRLPVSQTGNAPVLAVGHRVVHGGSFTAPVRVTPEVRARIEELTVLAPLHNPPSLETLTAAEAELPDVPHIAVFDTAFHATLPPEAQTYPLPISWFREWGIQRYGFHGLSHAYCARRAAELLGRSLESLRLVICHLGHGCSASAVRSGRCIETTMGFTPLEGLMMATRSGSVDPGLLTWVQQRQGLSAAELERVLNRQSGLLGVSGVSADMREVLAAARQSHADARLAVTMYCHRVRQAIGSLAVTLGGVDALIFTAGVGEHAGEIRAEICQGLECLGLQLDRAANAACQPDVDIALAGSPGRILILVTREDLTMLRDVAQVSHGGP